ncbi:MAG: hypothetical protein ABMA02_17540, partial [Saprospiraceae bacterium]
GWGWGCTHGARWSKEGNPRLLTIVLDHLSIARAHATAAHIGMARLRRLEGLDEEAEKHKAEALRRIQETGYFRRLVEAEVL